MAPTEWRCNHGDRSGIKPSFPLCSRNISRNSFSAQLRASFQPAQLLKPCLGEAAVIWGVEGCLVLSFTDFFFFWLYLMCLCVVKLDSCRQSSIDFSLWFPMYENTVQGSYGPLYPDCNLLIFQKGQKPRTCNC